MDVPQDEHERTIAFAEIALGQIKALGQSASPRNFEIWYNYATGYNQPLNQLINETLAKNGTLSETDLEQIYDTYLSDSRFGERIDTVGTRVLDEIKHVMSTIDAAAGSATTYSKSLNLASEELAQAEDGEARRTVVEHLVQGAKDMESSNKRLEARLEACGRRSSSCSTISRRCAPKASPIRSPRSPTVNITMPLSPRA
jgi:diguanylate cyclase